MRRVFAMILLALLTSAPVIAQQSSEQPADTAPSSDCLSRNIPVTVLKPTPTAWDWHSLKLNVGGKETPISSFSVITQPPRVLVLVDTSASMASYPEDAPGTPEWGVGLQAAAFAVQATPVDSSVRVDPFSDREMLGRFESRQQAANEISALQKEIPKKTTALYWVLRSAAKQLDPVQFGDTIFLVSDGGDNRSLEISKSAQQDLIARGIRVFLFLVAHVSEHRTPEEHQAMNAIALANATGGTVIQAPWSKQWLSSDEANRFAEQIRTMVRWPYKLQFQLDQPLQKAAKLKIVVPAIKPALELAYPHDLPPCSALASPPH